LARHDKASKKKRGFLLGALVGAAAGLLLAPRTGKETRDQLFGGGLDAEAQKERLREAMGAGRKSAAEASEGLKQKIEETRARLRDQMSE
jgi:gas vesicle protein